MTMMLLYWITLLFLVVRLLVAITNYLQQPNIEAKPPGNEALLKEVALLIPARNEAANLAHLLGNLRDVPFHQILILDDYSEDRTPEVVREYQQTMPNLELVQGAPLPEGWVGKNWACHQLGQNASGSNYYLFIDADVMLTKEGLIRTVQEVKTQKLGLLSVFPAQRMKTFGERTVVPIMHYLLLSLLPLSWVHRFASSSLVGASGQFMLFNADKYREHQWHEQVKDQVVEDMAIASKLKELGYQVEALTTQNMVQCRMYSGYPEALSGFAKNMHAMMGGSWIGMFIIVFFMILVYILLVPYIPPAFLAINLILIAILKIIICLHTGRNVISGLLLQPIQMFNVCRVVSLWLYFKLKSTYKWKGRKVPL